MSTAKKVSQDYECTRKWCTGFVFIFFFFFSWRRIAVVFSWGIVVHQLWSFAFSRKHEVQAEWRITFFFWSNWDAAPPGSWCPTQTAYSAYRERRYWVYIKQHLLKTCQNLIWIWNYIIKSACNAVNSLCFSYSLRTSITTVHTCTTTTTLSRYLSLCMSTNSTDASLNSSVERI